MNATLAQAVHIFRKDVRGLWPQIAILWTLLAVFTAYDPASHPEYFAPVIAVACWVLCASAVHQEALAGDLQFWLTRPYGRDSLLLAKLLFVVVFIWLPLLISGGILMARAGVPVLPNAAGLILLSLGQSIWLILPPFAMACVTSGLKQVVLAAAALIVIAAVSMNRTQTSFGAPAMIVIACAAIALQFNRRRTVQSSALLACAVIALVLPAFSDGLMALPTRILNPGFNSDRIELAFDETVPMRWDNRLPFGRQCGNLALKITGLPDGVTLTPFAVSSGSVQLLTASGRELSASMSRSSIEKQAGGYWENVCIFGPAGEPGEPLTLRWSTGFTVKASDRLALFPVRDGSFAVGRSGHCEVGKPDFLMCGIAAPTFGETSIGLEFAGYRSFSVNSATNEYFYPVLTPPSREAFYGPIDGSSDPWPVEEALNRPDARFVFRHQRVIGFIQRELVYRRLRLTR